MNEETDQYNSSEVTENYGPFSSYKANIKSALAPLTNRASSAINAIQGNNQQQNKPNSRFKDTRNLIDDMEQDEDAQESYENEYYNSNR